MKHPSSTLSVDSGKHIHIVASVAIVTANIPAFTVNRKLQFPQRILRSSLKHALCRQAAAVQNLEQYVRHLFAVAVEVKHVTDGRSEIFLGVFLGEKLPLRIYRQMEHYKIIHI